MKSELEPHFLEGSTTGSTKASDLDDLILCIAAVLQAIDHKQELRADRSAFAGGFALASELHLAMAMDLQY